MYARSQGGIGLIRSASGAQGPYEDLGLFWPAGHKPSLFADTRGQVYLLFDANKIAKLDLARKALVHKPRSLHWDSTVSDSSLGRWLTTHSPTAYLRPALAMRSTGSARRR